MVSTEENSLGDILGAALPKGVLAGLKGVTSPDAPLAYSAPTSDEPMAPGAAQAAAVAYLHDAPAQPRPNTADAEPHAPQLQLVADHGAAHGGHARSSGEQAEAEALRAARAVAINTVEDMIAEARTNNDTAAIARLQSVLQNLRGAKTLAALAAAQTALGAIDSDQKGEDKEQKIERLLQLQEEIEKTFKDNERYFTDDEKRERERLKAVRDQYPVGSQQWIDANKQLLQYDKEIAPIAANRADEAGDHNAARDLRGVVPIVDEAKQAMNQVIADNKSAMTQEAAVANQAAVNAPTSAVRAQLGELSITPHNDAADTNQVLPPQTSMQVAHVENTAAGNLPKPAAPGALQSAPSMAL